MTDSLRSEIRFAMVPESILYHDDLSPYDIVVWAAIIRHAGPSGSFPSYARLARLLGIHRTTVIKSVDTLVDVGALRKIPRTDDSGDATSNEYVVIDPGGGSADRPPVVGSTDHGGSADRPEREQGNQSPKNDKGARVDEAFEAWWRDYPKTSGRKPQKAHAARYWARMSDDDRDAATIGLRHYLEWRRVRARRDEFVPEPPYAIRWLRNREYDEHQDPPGTSTVTTCKACRQPVASHDPGHCPDPNGPIT